MVNGLTLELSVSEFVALLNQTLEYAYPDVVIVGELTNYKVSKNRWVYFDLRDETSAVRFFGTVYQLPGPLEDGMMLKVRGQPRLHQKFGFSVNILSIQPAGEGTIRRAAELLRASLAAEGLFDESRKRRLPYPPQSVGLITSKQSAAYADFIKIINARWQGITINLLDVQVQGELSPVQIEKAFEQFNSQADPPEVIVLIRGGGSAEDLAAFSTEQVTRAVAGSRVPTMVAIGHEIDLSLAELAADLRASTPSNAAELLVPDRNQVLAKLTTNYDQIRQLGNKAVIEAKKNLTENLTSIEVFMENVLGQASQQLQGSAKLLSVLNPDAVLRRGYAIVRNQNQLIRKASQLKSGDIVEVRLSKGQFGAVVKDLEKGI
jgi:exodeoxyribonuclease VII large subunit